MTNVENIAKKVEVANYPYGRLKTSAFFSVEFKKGKGFRHIFQTINPKNGELNKPKAGTYSTIAFLTTDENNFVTQRSSTVYGLEENNKIIKFIAENQDKLQLTNDMLYFILSSILASNKASFAYMGAKFERIKENIARPHIEAIISMFKADDYSMIKLAIIDLEELNKQIL